jgi:hypothetical protein
VTPSLHLKTQRDPVSGTLCFLAHHNNNNSVALVRERTIPTKRPPLVGELSANFCGYRVKRGQRNGSLCRSLGFLDGNDFTILSITGNIYKLQSTFRGSLATMAWSVLSSCMCLADQHSTIFTLLRGILPSYAIKCKVYAQYERSDHHVPSSFFSLQLLYFPLGGSPHVLPTLSTQCGHFCTATRP